MIRRLLRDYLSLSRSERRGLQFLGILLVTLCFIRIMLPGQIHAIRDNDPVANSEVAAFVDSLLKIDSVLLSGKTDPEATRVSGQAYRKPSYLNPSDTKPSYPGYGLPEFELNRADSGELVSVYGIGPVFARRIIRYRNLLGGFHDSLQLLEVYNLDPEQFAELCRRSFIDTSCLRKIDLNMLDAWSISSHPYINLYQSRAIVSYREQMGSFGDLQEILDNDLLPDSVFLRIYPYLEIVRQDKPDF